MSGILRGVASARAPIYGVGFRSGEAHALSTFRCCTGILRVGRDSNCGCRQLLRTARLRPLRDRSIPTCSTCSDEHACISASSADELELDRAESVRDGLGVSAATPGDVSRNEPAVNLPSNVQSEPVFASDNPSLPRTDATLRRAVHTGVVLLPLERLAD